MAVRFVQFGKGYKTIHRKLDRVMKKVLSEGRLILQKEGEEFEQKLAHYIGTKHAIGVANGTDALFLILKAMGIKAGDEVITCSHTFVATAQVIQQCGATPVLVDIRDDGLMHADDIRPFITPNTKAIIAVQLTGDVCNMDEILALGLPVVEDSCQAIGADWNGRKAGSMGVAGAFSFYPAKILGCFGDGGAVVTNDDALADEIRELRNHYKRDYSKWAVNSRLDNLQAAVLSVKLDELPKYLAKRERIAKYYLKHLKKLVGLPVDRPGRVWQDFVIRTPRRDELFAFLKDRGVETMKNDYPFPIPKGPNSIQYENETLRLPCNPEMTLRDAREVVQEIKAFFA